jgi:hypothetical protein
LIKRRKEREKKEQEEKKRERKEKKREREEKRRKKKEKRIVVITLVYGFIMTDKKKIITSEVLRQSLVKF